MRQAAVTSANIGLNKAKALEKKVLKLENEIKAINDLIGKELCLRYVSLCSDECPCKTSPWESFVSASYFRPCV